MGNLTYQCMRYWERTLFLFLESQMESPNTANYGITAETTFLTRAATDIVGNEYSLGLGVHVVAADNSSDEIWVTSFVLTAATTNLPSFVSCFIPLLAVSRYSKCIYMYTL